MNRLKDGECLEFAPEGLTVIYGNNGSGKSGYTRILRSVCYSRADKPEVLANVFSKNSSAPSAQIVAEIDGSEQTFQWDSKRTSDLLFPEVTVFDQESSTFEIRESNTVVFRPRYIEMFTQLAALVIRVKDCIKEASRDEQRDNPFPHVPSQYKATFQELRDGKGKLDDLCLRDGDAERLDEIDQSLAPRSDGRIAELQGKLKQMTEIQNIVMHYASFCTRETLTSYENIV